MAINHDTLRLAEHLRIIVGREVDETTRQLVQAWARAWEQVNVEWQLAIAELVAIGGGKWPTRRQIARATRAQQALALTYRHVVRLAELAGVTVSTSARTVTSETAFWQARLIASQLPPGTDTVSVAATFDRVDPVALEWIVDRTTQQVTALHKPLTDDMTEAMKRALVRGVAVGDNPRKVADDMLRQVQHRFNGGLTRALIIARTEMLDAHRAAAHAQHAANADVLAGWYWHAKLDRRTCPSCWAQHGQLHELDQPGPLDHQQGRCTRLPKLKTWEDLGFEGLDEPDDEIQDARAVFDAMAYDDQLAVMGPKRLRALQQGQIAWEDLSLLRPSVGWRDSYGVAPIGTGGTGGGGSTPAGPTGPQQPGRYNLGDTLLTHLVSDDEVRAAIQQAVDAIASVHGIDAVMPDLPVMEFVDPGDDDGMQLGSYGFDDLGGNTGEDDEYGDSVAMTVNLLDPGKAATLIHELGHFLDHKGLGADDRHFASASDPLMAGWWQAVSNSQAFDTIMQMMRRYGQRKAWAVFEDSNGTLHPWMFGLKSLFYWRQVRELWARSYAQWIALRSGNEDLMRQVMAMAALPDFPDTLVEGDPPVHPAQWTEEDFAPIAEALDTLFGSLGLLRRQS